MFGLAPSELLIILVVALICIGPSDLPRAMKTVAKWMNMGRKLAREFQGHVDDLVREADLEELRDQARKLSTQSLADHIESAVDPNRELSRALSPDLPHDAAAMPVEADIGATAAEPLLPGLTPEPAATPTMPEAASSPVAQLQGAPEPVSVAHGG